MKQIFKRERLELSLVRRGGLSSLCVFFLFFLHTWEVSWKLVDLGFGLRLSTATARMTLHKPLDLLGLSFLIWK